MHFAAHSEFSILHSAFRALKPLRIVAGKWKGRRLKPPADERVRPTADRVREAWMSIVQPHLADARVLDLFAGSGALGIEALSRGARQADFVELAARSLAALRDNLRLVGAEEDATVHRGDALKFAAKLSAQAFDVAFADPPYRLGLAEQLAAQWLAVPFARVLGIEHEKSVQLPEPGDRRTYGDTVVTFYRMA
jgi:16S rRNA (guanine966-N2)-methyltransferase